MNKINNFSVKVYGQEDKTPRIRFTGDFEAGSPIPHLDFIMTRVEFHIFVFNYGSAMDGYTHLDSIGELVCLYKMEMNYTASSGKVEVPFVNFQMPGFVRRIIWKAAAQIWSGPTAGTITVSQKKLDKWVTNYGCGTGRVELKIDESLKDKFESCLADTTFVSSFDRLKKIAQNSTKTFFNTASLFLFNDSHGFYWIAKNHLGDTIMNGGLIKHGNNDWSIHT